MRTGAVLEQRLGGYPRGHPGRPAHDRHHDQAQQPQGRHLLDHHERGPPGDDALEELRVRPRSGAGVQGKLKYMRPLCFFFMLELYNYKPKQKTLRQQIS